MRWVHAAPAIVMLALSGIMVAATLPLGLWDGFTPGPAFFPILIGIFASVLAILLLLAVWRGDSIAADWPARPVLVTVGSVYAALVAFALLTPLLGMLPAIAVFLVVVMVVLLRQPVVGSLIAATVTTALIYVIFVRWLALPLPDGIFGI